MERLEDDTFVWIGVNMNVCVCVCVGVCVYSVDRNKG